MTCRIFINYRRQTDAGSAGRIYDSLKRQLPHAVISIDVDSLLPGRDFEEQLNARISECDVFLAVIGPDWSDARDAVDVRRLEDPRDLVRREIATALQRGIPVVPVLVGAATMPPDDALPHDIQELAKRQALAVRHERFESDMSHVAGAIVSSSSGASGKRATIPRAGAIVLVTVAALIAARLAGPHIGRTLSTPDDRSVQSESTHRAQPAGVEVSSSRPAFNTKSRSGAASAAPGSSQVRVVPSREGPTPFAPAHVAQAPSSAHHDRSSDLDSDGRWSEWLSRDAYQALFDSRARSGMYPVKVEAKLSGNISAFRGIFEPLGPTIEEFESRSGIDDAAFAEYDSYLRSEGYSRLFHTRLEAPAGALNQATWIRTYAARDSVESFAPGSGAASVRLAASRDSSGGRWSAWMSTTDYQANFDRMVRLQRFPIKVEARFANDTILVRAVFVRYPHGAFEFDSRVLLSDADFETRTRELSRLRLVFHQRIVVAGVAYNQATWSR